MGHMIVTITHQATELEGQKKGPFGTTALESSE